MTTNPSYPREVRLIKTDPAASIRRTGAFFLHLSSNEKHRMAWCGSHPAVLRPVDLGATHPTGRALGVWA